ncbi:hypothetical protein KAX35_00485 [candidate division WOR-3 bacterium]|nr:hypothetical protein [candidate division WOR-3 bacterium]
MFPTLIILVLNAVFIPVEAGVNEVIDELRVRGVPVVRFANTLPYKMEDVAKNKEEIKISPGSQILIDKLKFLEISEPEVRFYISGQGINDTVTRYFQDIGVIASLPGINICIQPFIRLGESDEYPIFFWHDIIGGDFRRAYGSIEFGGLDILIGREPLRWGPQPGNSFILSGTSPAFDLIYASYEYNFFKGSFFCTSLDPYILEDSFEAWWRRETLPAGTYKRFFSGHRLDFSLFDDRFLISLSEVLMYSGEDINFISGYLNPFNFYWAQKRNRGKGEYEDNIGWGFDFSYYIRDGLCLFGELFIDDAQYGETEENIPNMLAYRMGLKGARGKDFWTMQYTRVNTWTYIHQFYWNDYLFIGYPIGHPKGQDFDEIYGRVVHHLNYNWDITLDFWYTRKGENSFDNLWPGIFPEHIKFPSGVVERSLSVEAGVRFFNLPRLSVEVVGGYTWIGNYRNVANENKWFPSVRVRVSSVIF